MIKWQCAIIWWLLKHRNLYRCILAADLDTGLAGLLAAKLLGKRLVYDIYDFYADSRLLPGLIGRAAQTMELSLVSRADATILAAESRIAQLNGVKPRRLATVYNIPHVLPTVPAPPGRGQRPELTVAYVGVLSMIRGLSELISVVSEQHDWRLEIGGFGPDEGVIRKCADGTPNIRFHGRVCHEKAMKIYSDADVIVATYDPEIPNHRYSSPNKLFEAAALGKPLVVARGTGVDELVTKYQLGAVVDYGSTEGLAVALGLIAKWSPGEREAFVEHARTIVRDHFNFEANWSRLVDVIA
ncbi:MAG: glycosyltransferase [Bryobacteraceae bacterium]